MLNRKLIYSLLVFLIVIGLVMGGIILYSFKNNELKVFFLDVGQGDAILISQGGSQVLIDGGRDGKILLEKLGRRIPFWDRQIEIIIATHPDQDHIGGLIDVLRAYGVNTIIETKAGSQSQVYKVWTSAVSEEEAVFMEALAGLKIKFVGGAVGEILYPTHSINDSDSNNSNESSVVLRIDFGENSFIFAGDLPEKQENELIVKNIDFLKVSHHGSKHSTSESFLDKLNPREAIISVGKNNSYGHPNQEALDRLIKRKINIRRTDEMGDIVYKCENIDSTCLLVAN